MMEANVSSSERSSKSLYLTANIIHEAINMTADATSMAVDSFVLLSRMVLIFNLKCQISHFYVLFLLVRRPVLGQSPCLAQGLSDDPLKLSVGGTELVGGPFLDCAHRIGIDTKNETFCGVSFFGHYQMLGDELHVERSRIDYWLCVGLAAEHHHEIGHHGGLLVFVEFNHLLIAQFS